MLSVDSLLLHRGGKAVLHGISLRVPPGEVTALLGANGAGKSSTVMAIAGALPVSGGRIEVEGQALHDRRPEHVRGLGVAVVPEGHRVLGELSVLDNLRAAATLLPLADVQPAIARVLAIFPELEPKLTLAGRSLSGGQKQMVCIAQALIGRPRYLAIDELSLGLSPMIVKRLAEVVQQVARDGVGVLLIEQFTTLALAISSRAYVLERGRMAFEGTSDDLRQRPEILHSSYLAGG
ncbi:MAG: ATP-binding cassette domain-containing protein [Ideonella sp.]|nr:ATP-binding cassette domain-containing protein [Ideonella sp.]